MGSDGHQPHFGHTPIVGFENENLSGSLREGYDMRQPGIRPA
jgi:hypothetical protein